MEETERLYRIVMMPFLHTQVQLVLYSTRLHCIIIYCIFGVTEEWMGGGGVGGRPGDMTVRPYKYAPIFYDLKFTLLITLYFILF